VNRLLNYLSDQAWASVVEGRGHADALANMKRLKLWASLGAAGSVLIAVLAFLVDGVLTTFEANPLLAGMGAGALRPYLGAGLAVCLAASGCIALWNLTIFGLVARRMEGD
jgi:hypothetical protein